MTTTLRANKEPLPHLLTPPAHTHSPPQIARNRLGLNDKAHEIAKEEAVKEKLKAEKEKEKAEKEKAKKRKH